MEQEVQDVSYIDCHTHVQSFSYDEDRKEVIERAKQAGVKMITVGTQMATSAAGVLLAEENRECMWATVGFHPNHVVEDHPEWNGGTKWYHDKKEQKENVPEIFDAAKMRTLATHPQVVAIGECGLDYFRIEGSEEEIQESKKQQHEIFLSQIEIAKEVAKPLMIHCRNAFPDLIEVLSATRYMLQATSGIIHFFTGSPADARALLDLGFSFTFGGVITFTRDYDEVIKLIPLDRILSETDAPYVAPVPYRGKRNEPAYVVEVVKKLAEIKGVPLEEMREAILKNAERIFRIEIL